MDNGYACSSDAILRPRRVSEGTLRLGCSRSRRDPNRTPYATFYVPAGSPKGPCDLDVRGAGAIAIERLMPLLEFLRPRRVSEGTLRFGCSWSRRIPNRTPYATFYVPAGSPKGPCDLDVRGAGGIPIERLMPLYVRAGSPKGPCDLDVRGAGGFPIEPLMPLLEFF